jgi:hypothetical protein
MRKIALLILFLGRIAELKADPMLYRIDWTATFSSSPDVAAPLPTLFTYDSTTALFSETIVVRWPIGPALVDFDFYPNFPLEFSRRVLFGLLEGGGTFSAANIGFLHDATLDLDFTLGPGDPRRFISHVGRPDRNEQASGTWAMTPVSPSVKEPELVSLLLAGLLGIGFLKAIAGLIS